MRTVYHKQLGMAVYPGMVSSSNAEFIAGVVETPGPGMGNNMLRGIAVGMLAGHPNGASANAVAPSNATSSGVVGAFGVIAASPASTNIEMLEAENTSQVYPDGKPVIPYVRIGEVCNVLVSGKIWVVTERATGLIQPPMSPVYAFHGWARTDLNTNANNKTPFYFTGVPGVPYYGGLWLQEILLP